MGKVSVNEMRNLITMLEELKKIELSESEKTFLKWLAVQEGTASKEFTSIIRKVKNM